MSEENPIRLISRLSEEWLAAQQKYESAQAWGIDREWHVREMQVARESLEESIKANLPEIVAFLLGAASVLASVLGGGNVGACSCKSAHN